MDALTLFSSNNSSCFYNDYDEGCACAVMGRVRMRSDGEKRVCAFSGKKKKSFCNSFLSVLLVDPALGLHQWSQRPSRCLLWIS